MSYNYIVPFRYDLLQRRSIVWKNMNALALMFMMKQSAIPTAVSLPAQSGKIFPMIGYAPYAVWVKANLQSCNATAAVSVMELPLCIEYVV